MGTCIAIPACVQPLHPSYKILLTYRTLCVYALHTKEALDDRHHAYLVTFAQNLGVFVPSPTAMQPIAWRDLTSYIAHLGRFFWRKFRRHVSAIIIVSLLVSVLLNSLNYILPIIGRIYLPSRRSQQPRLPYGLSLVDVNIDSLYAVSINAEFVL